MDEKEKLIRNIRRINRNVRDRIKRIESKEDLPQYGATSYRNFEKRLKEKGNLSKLSIQELNTINRDIVYLDTSVKTTRVEGAELAQKYYEPFKEKLSALSKEKQAEVMDTYNKIIDRFADFAKYKYELLNVSVNEIYGGSTPDDIVKKIFDLYDSLILNKAEGNSAGITNEDVKVFIAKTIRGF